MSPATRIKICGLTRPQDARLSRDLGADYLGVIFARSPRRIDAARAREIRDAVPDARLVGVFADADVDRIVRVTAAVGLDLVQLHGAESPKEVRKIAQRTRRPIIKAFAGSELPRVDLLARFDRAGFFLFDLGEKAAREKPRAGESGGDKLAIDPFRRTQVAVSRTRRKGFRVFMAGALNPENIRGAVEESGAYGVDVCRGVEKRPGIKDPKKLEQFIKEARG